MKLFLKSILRRKTTKIYVFVVMFIFLSLFLLLCLRKYYTDLVLNSFYDGAYIDIVSPYDVSDAFTEKNMQVSSGVLLSFEDSSFTNCINSFGLEDYNYFAVFPSEELTGNMTIVPYQIFLTDENPYVNYIGSSFVGINSVNQKAYSFDIQKYYESDQCAFYVSSSKLEEIQMNQDYLYFYRLKHIEPERIELLTEELQNKINDEEVVIRRLGMPVSDSSRVKRLNYALLFLGVLFLGALVIIYSNMLSDNEMKNQVFLLYGAKKWQMKGYNFFFLVLFNLVAYMLMLVFSLGAFYLFKKYARISLVMIPIGEQLLLIGIAMFLSFVLALLKRVKLKYFLD